MRGIVLAGGTGSRLDPLTRTINKHLLPVWDRHMIMWPIQTLKDNDIEDITVVSSASGVEQIAAVLGGEYTYKVQNKPGGIPQAMLCGQDGTDERVAVILGDNVFLPAPVIRQTLYDYSAVCYLHRSGDHDLTQFGVARFKAGAIEEVVEKPSDPPSWYVATGLYVFDYGVFDLIPSLAPSRRGELEVSDLLNLYAADGKLGFHICQGFWMDAGTVDNLLDCSCSVRRHMTQSGKD